MSRRFRKVLEKDEKMGRLLDRIKKELLIVETLMLCPIDY